VRALEEGLIAGMRDADVPVAGVETTGTDPSQIGWFRDRGLPSVDNLDHVPGKAALVFVLSGDADGTYGEKSSAEGLLPRVVARVNKGGTPDISLFGTALVVLLLIATGTFSSVLALAAFFFVLQYAVSFTSLFILRRREPQLPRPYRAIGYPVIPAIVLLGALAFIVGSFFGDRDNTLKSVLVLLASYPAYRVVLRLRARSA